MNPLDPTTTTRLLALPSLREQAYTQAYQSLSIPRWTGEPESQEPLFNTHKTGQGTLWEDVE